MGLQNDNKFILIGDCRIDPSARICAGTVIGKSYRPLVGISQQIEERNITIIGPKVYLGYYTVIGAGSVLEEEVVVDDHCIIENDVHVGKRTIILYKAQICNDVRIGQACVIGGFVGERVVIGNRCRIFGKIVHLQYDPHIPWDAPEAEEASAVIEDEVFIGFDAIVIGGVKIGRRSYICAGTIITKDVPPFHIAYGVNQIIHYTKWKGKLRNSPFFKTIFQKRHIP